MKRSLGIGLIVFIVLVNIPAQWLVWRWDLTADKRYTLSSQTKQEMHALEETLDITLLLQGDLNSGFKRLDRATRQMVSELGMYGPVRVHDIDSEILSKSGLTPTIIHEREQNGRTIQTTIYPYAQLTYKDRSLVVPLLQNQRGLSGEENLNRSIEGLEYTLAEAIHSLRKTEVERIAFLEGHGELPEQNVYDLSTALSRYYQIDRGVLGYEVGVLDEYKCVIVADPQLPFSETDKYILDQYLMQGGCILWLINGVKFSQNSLEEGGATPIMPLDLNLTDMLFRYGVRVNPMLVQDLQCLPVPVDVSRDPTNPNFQPMPWTYAPLLLTNESHPVTHGVAQVLGTFVSCIDCVGGNDEIHKDILMATSTASAMTSAPAEVNLTDLTVETERFSYAYIPVSTTLEGQFQSLFAHRLTPDSIQSDREPIKLSTPTRQIIIAAGSIARNEWQQSQPLPLGYDRYSGTQFGNRDMLVNAVLWLCDNNGLINLRQKSVALRLLNDQRAHNKRMKIQILSLLLPLLLITLTGGIIVVVRRKKYTK